MSLAAKIENLPSPNGGGYYTIELLCNYTNAFNQYNIRHDVVRFGYYLARGESSAHELIVLEELKDKLKLVINGIIEKRKNSWVNQIRSHLQHRDDKAIASMIASFWLRTLGETSLKKAQLSEFGYQLNGQSHSNTKKQKEFTSFCEWCHKEINVSKNKWFQCPYCKIYFQGYNPQTIHILYQIECSYEMNCNDF